MQRVLSFRQLQLYSFAVCTFSSWQVSTSGLCISLQTQLQGMECGLVPANLGYEDGYLQAPHILIDLCSSARVLEL